MIKIVRDGPGRIGLEASILAASPPACRPKLVAQERKPPINPRQYRRVDERGHSSLR
jgi:hypothetical protein